MRSVVALIRINFAPHRCVPQMRFLGRQCGYLRRYAGRSSGNAEHGNRGGPTFGWESWLVPTRAFRLNGCRRGSHAIHINALMGILGQSVCGPIGVEWIGSRALGMIGCGKQARDERGRLRVHKTENSKIWVTANKDDFIGASRWQRISGRAVLVVTLR
jgi:hypothetical protein